MTNEILELSDADLNTVTGGACADAAALFKEARADFAKGDFIGGFHALAEGRQALKSCQRQP